MPCDVKLAGVLVIDGSGAPAFRADVAIAEGRIAAIGDLAALEARTTLEVGGSVVAPGFIDLHSHSDWLMPGSDVGELVEPFLRQGMTSLVGGNCGFSPAPVSAKSRGAARSASLLMADAPLEPRWETMDAFLGGLEVTGVPLVSIPTPRTVAIVCVSTKQMDSTGSVGRSRGSTNGNSVPYKVTNARTLRFIRRGNTGIAVIQ